MLRYYLKKWVSNFDRSWEILQAKGFALILQLQEIRIHRVLVESYRPRLSENPWLKWVFTHFWAHCERECKLVKYFIEFYILEWG